MPSYIDLLLSVGLLISVWIFVVSVMYWSIYGVSAKVRKSHARTIRALVFYGEGRRTLPPCQKKPKGVPKSPLGQVRDSHEIARSDTKSASGKCAEYSRLRAIYEDG